MENLRHFRFKISDCLFNFMAYKDYKSRNERVQYFPFKRHKQYLHKLGLTTESPSPPETYSSNEITGESMMVARTHLCNINYLTSLFILPRKILQRSKKII